jgi:hypothetical protein
MSKPHFKLTIDDTNVVITDELGAEVLRAPFLDQAKTLNELGKVTGKRFFTYEVIRGAAPKGRSRANTRAVRNVLNEVDKLTENPEIGGDVIPGLMPADDYLCAPDQPTGTTVPTDVPTTVTTTEEQ